MMHKGYLKIILAVAVLAACLAGQAFGEKLQNRVSQGNNMQVQIYTGQCGPFYYDHRAQGKHMWPAGSGNTWGHGAMGFMACAVSDLDGDGAIEDTIMPPHGRNCFGFLGSPEAVDEVAAIYASGLSTESIAGDINHWRVWSSLDDDDLADWPVGGREGRSPSGEIIKHGAETIFTATGDVLRGYGYGHPTGYYQENSFYFLNYGESNDMVYVETETFNMTELLKYSSNPDFVAIGSAHPSGWTWNGAAAFYQHRYMTWGASNSPWSNLFGYHYAKDINVTFNQNPLQKNWNPPEYALFCFASLKLPTATSTGEQMEMTNFNAAGGSMGVSGSLQLALSGKSPGQVYRNIMDTEDFLPGVINPYSGRHHNAWPGRLLPTDARYNQWVWGGGGPWITDKCYGELHDIAPRESYEFDYVMFFVYPDVIPFTPPPLEVGNIDAAVIQEGLAPAERYTDVARVVYNGGYQLPETPQPPALTIIPGDREVTITWSDVAVNTPDNYYYFLQESNLDPEGRYVEYDFEGFRIYRSFVGPNDTHSELLGDFNRSQNNLQFYYMDKLDNDYPMYRMRNGMKVWYAVVPYDKNYDLATGEFFSLPDPASAKTWNRPGEAIYSVVPRSEASNYLAASLQEVSYVGPATVATATAELAGSGGVLTEAPKWLEPQLDFELDVVNSERITQDITVYVAVTKHYLQKGMCWVLDGIAEIKMLDPSGNVLGEPMNDLNPLNDADLIIMNAPDADGVNYAIHAIYTSYEMRAKEGKGNLHINLDPGTYTGASIDAATEKCVFGPAPTIQGMVRAGQFEVTWKEAGGGLSVDVQNVTRGIAVPFGQYADEHVWGFMPGGTYADFWNDLKNGVPQADRANLLLETIPADNTDEFAFYVNGIVWEFTDITAMPAAGTTFTTYACYGSWNEDGTVLTQRADPPVEDDQWKIEIKAMSLEPEDADISKVKVVPNPYIASSYLDLSPNNRRVEFTNLPSRCTIRIYSLGGNLVNVLNHIGANRQGWGDYTDWDKLSDNQPREFTGYDNHSGTEPWNLRNRFGQTVASGLYFYHVTDQRGEEFTGKFYVIN